MHLLSIASMPSNVLSIHKQSIILEIKTKHSALKQKTITGFKSATMLTSITLCTACELINTHHAICLKIAYVVSAAEMQLEKLYYLPGLELT